jgi:DNA-binding NtrC family response regulator
MAQPPKNTSKLPAVPPMPAGRGRSSPPPPPGDSRGDATKLARSRYTLLVVEDDAAMRELLQDTLSEEGFVVDTAGGGRAGIDRVRRGGIDLVVTDVRMPDLDGLDMLREIVGSGRGGESFAPPHVIVITAFGSIDTAIKAVRLGAHDYITKPFNMEALILAADKALEERGLRHEVSRLQREVERPYRFENIIGRSPQMQEVFNLIRRMASSSVNVLITGESGTGKELVARAIHYNSPRAKRPFVPVNCAAIPDALLESELFGHKRGAFTDARSDRAGMFVEADGGTLFLDEIGDLSPALQAKLLRVIAEREIRPLGATRSEKIDVRVISATHKDLQAGMRSGTFREDLYYRLNVLQIHLPPLRDRAEDVLPLADHFLQRAADRSQKRVSSFSQSALKILLSHGWPGNVRELENIVERAVALCEASQVTPSDLPAVMRERRPSDLVDYAVQRNLTLADLEREYIARVMKDEGGNKTRAAQRLGLDRKTLYRKLEETSRPEIGTASDAADESTPRPSDPSIAATPSPDDE